MSEHPILVTGATGKSGRRVVSQLRAKGLPVRAAARNGEHHFDWTDSGTWDAALEDVRSLYIVQLDGTKLVRPFVERAVRHGVRRIVLASGRGIDNPDYAKDSSGVLEGIVDSEAAVRESGLEWTISRPGWFAQNFSEGFFADAVLAGELRLPAGDGAAGFVDAEDIAAVVTAALTEDGHAGQIYELSGPRAVTLTEAVATISEATGRDIRYVPLSVERYVAELVQQGLPPADAEAFADVIEPLREGRDAYVSDGVQRALGRPPRTFAEFAKSTADGGGWPG
ncbi:MULTISPECIES: SDR family oxidoreductase [unclassified Streptomyces]|uniref:SDR family oxidoreductase n=1 Tax=unclassified Streptomyces TaxID=2593676 RepID=UPI002E789CC8|nr:MULTISPECIES: SDR family oxidoreductase [unclassified Streptomyces]MEE1759784.1 SDR family oxidoreductase [Streptomyces sp. SP18BB07]MEE1830187.1 SDR family oxidoreductase [Streptomyces sp. SP17KL33]